MSQVYKITLVQHYLGQWMESVYHIQVDYLVIEPQQAEVLADAVRNYLNSFVPDIELLMSNQWSCSHFNLHWVVPGVGESLVAAPIYIGVGDQNSTPLPPQIAVQTAVKGFLHAGTSKKYFPGLATNGILNGSLTTAYQAAFTTIAQMYATPATHEDLYIVPGWMSTAKVNGETPSAPYFVPFLPSSAIARPEVSDLGKRKKGRGI